MGSKKHTADVDLAGNALVNLTIEGLAIEPAPIAGGMYYNTVSKTLKYSDGAAWKDLSSDLLSGLTDTDFSSFNTSLNNQYLIYNATTKKWIPKELYSKLAWQDDVSTLGAKNNEVLTYDSGTWVPKLVRDKAIRIRSNYTLTDDDSIITVDAGSGAVTATLQTPSLTHNGRKLTFKLLSIPSTANSFLIIGDMYDTGNLSRLGFDQIGGAAELVCSLGIGSAYKWMVVNTHRITSY